MRSSDWSSAVCSPVLLHDDVAERIVAQPADCGGGICSADLAAGGTVPVLTDAAPTRSDAATSRQAPPTVIPRSSQHQLTDTREQPPLFEDRHLRRRRRCGGEALHLFRSQIGRASCRERVCQYV